MACGCEKDKANKECNDFTKAVINIENPEVLTLFHKVVIPASMGDEEAVPPAVGKYCNTLLYYEASENAYLYSSDGIPTKVTFHGKDGVIQYTAGTGIDITNNVISATGVAVVSWGDINGDLSNQTDLSTALAGKQPTLTAGANISIDANNEISATDTTYTHFTGATSSVAGAAGLVPAPTTSDPDKYLKGDGTWSTVQTGATITTFHWGGSPNYSMYKDSGYTTPATYSDIAAAYADGLVFIADGEDETTYVVTSDVPDSHTITVTGIGFPGNDGVSNSYAYASSTWTKTATQFQTKLSAGTNIQINGATISATDTTYNDFVGTDGVSAGTHGLVPAPATTDANAFLKGDGTWGNPPGTTYTAGANIQINGSTISATDTTYSNFGGATTLVAGSAGLVPAPTTADPDKFLKGDGTWGTPTDTTYSDFTGTDGVSAGTAGLVPGPTTSDTDKYLKSDGTWATVSGGGGSNITMTNVDPGEGSPLAADSYIAVYGNSLEGGFSRYAVQQAVPANTGTLLLANSTNTADVGVSYNSGVITIQKAGWWIFTTSVGGNLPTTGGLSVDMQINDVNIASAAGAATANYVTTRTVSWIGKMQVGDTVKVNITSGSAITLNTGTNKHRGAFTGALIYAS